MKIFFYLALFWMPYSSAMFDRLLDQHHREHAQDLAFIRSSNTPFICAATVGNCRICMDVTINDYQQSSWRWRCCSSSFKINEDLLQAAWHAAGCSDKTWVLETLFERFPQKNQISKIISFCKAGRPLLFHAVNAFNLEAVKLLLHHGADVNQPSELESLYGQYTPLMLAAHKVHSDRDKQIELIKVLLAHGARVNMRRKETNETALVVSNGNYAIMDLLVDHGAYIDEQSCGVKAFDFIFDKVERKKGCDTSAYRTLLKKIITQGSVRPEGKNDHICEIPFSFWSKQACTKNVFRDHFCVSYELIMKRLLQKFNQVGFSREIQAKILSYVPMSRNMCSFSLLRMIRQYITPEHCAAAVAYIPDRGIQEIVRILSPEYRSIFLGRMAEALTQRKLKIIQNLMAMPIQNTEYQLVVFLKNQIPDYFPLSNWPPPQLVTDIKNHYTKLLLGQRT